MISSRRNGLCPTLRHVNGEVLQCRETRANGRQGLLGNCEIPTVPLQLAPEDEVKQAVEVCFGLAGQSNPEGHLRVLADLGDLAKATTRGVELALQRSDDIVGIDVVTGAPGRVTRAQATGNELGLDAPALDAGTHRGLDELREALAFGQHRLDFGPELGLDAHGRNRWRSSWNAVYRNCATRSNEGTPRIIVPVVSIGLTTCSANDEPSSFSDAAGARRLGPPVSGRTYMQPAWSGDHRHHQLGSRGLRTPRGPVDRVSGQHQARKSESNVQQSRAAGTAGLDGACRAIPDEGSAPVAAVFVDDCIAMTTLDGAAVRSFQRCTQLGQPITCDVGMLGGPGFDGLRDVRHASRRRSYSSLMPRQRPSR